MKEIEVKILNINKSQIIAKLEELNAKKLEQVFIEDYFFDFSDNSIKLKNEELRLRIINKKNATLTYKKNRNTIKNLKQMDEYETQIFDYETMFQILKSLNLDAIPNLSKERITYILNNARFEIDTYQNIPTYLEIEAPTESEVYQAIEIIGYTISDTTTLNSAEIIKQFENGIPLRKGKQLQNSTTFKKDI